MSTIFILSMQFLRSSTQFAKIQSKAFWGCFNVGSFVRQYMLTNIYSTILFYLVTASRSREYQEDLIQKDMDQLALRNKQANGFYWVSY